jgi:drug/metabolite transporter (DMT)-like permease
MAASHTRDHHGGAPARSSPHAAGHVTVAVAPEPGPGPLGQGGGGAEEGGGPPLLSRERHDALVTFGWLLAWFALNVVIGNINKWLLHSNGFDYPFSLTLCHQLAGWGLSRVWLYFSAPPLPPLAPETARGVAWLALVFTCSIGLGNLALCYIYVSFAQMVGATTPLFTVVLARLLLSKSHTWAVYGSMVPIAVGVMLSVKGELNFVWAGFVATTAATLLRALKSVMQEKLLKEKLDAMTLLYYMSRWSVVMLAAAVAVFERPVFSDPALAAGPLIYMQLGVSSVIAWALNIANFTVTKRTSATTLQVLGNVKVVISILVSVLVFGNRQSVAGLAGCAVTLGGVAMYERAKGGPKA